MFIGLALAATSIGITSRVLAEMGVLDRTFARVVLGAAVIDDVLAMILIGLVSGAAAGDVSASTLLVAVAAVGLVGLGFAAARRARGLSREVFTWPLFADTPLVPAFILMFALALISAAIGLAAIIGAFVAGLIVAETEARDELEHEMRPLGQIFIPFFFAVTGAQLDLRALFDEQVLAIAILLTVVGVITKALGGFLGARSLGRWSATTVGFGMVPRGEVGIVVVNLGLTAGLLSSGLFSAILVAVIGTTVIAPYLLQWSIPVRPPRRRRTWSYPPPGPGSARLPVSDGGRDPVDPRPRPAPSSADRRAAGGRRSRRGTGARWAPDRATRGTRGRGARSRPATSRGTDRRSGRCRTDCPAADRPRPFRRTFASRGRSRRRRTSGPSSSRGTPSRARGAAASAAVMSEAARSEAAPDEERTTHHEGPTSEAVSRPSLGTRVSGPFEVVGGALGRCLR